MIYHDLDGYCGDDDDDNVVNQDKDDDDEDDDSSNPPHRLICLSWTFASGAAQTAARLLSRHLPSIESTSLLSNEKRQGMIDQNISSTSFFLPAAAIGS